MAEPRSDRLSRPGETTAESAMVSRSTAVVLIGFQNEYFAATGALHGDITDTGAPARVLATTVGLLDRLAGAEALIVATPIVFTPTYAELVDPVGVLAAIKARRAFQVGTDGVRLVEDLERFRSRIVEIEGRRGLNAFVDTDLDGLLTARGIRDVVIAGALTCVCIDSTARSAHERGYRVTILSDCTMGRTRSEHRLFCARIFPLYAQVSTSDQVVDRLSVSSEAS